MKLQYTPYTIPLVAALLLAVAGTVIAWSQRDSEAETWSTVVQLSITLWILLNLLTISSVSLAWKLGWYRLFFPSVGLLVVSLLAFTLHFTGRSELLTRQRLALLFSYPAGIFLVSVTNPFHELILVDPVVDTSGSFALLVYDWGPGLYVLVAVAYAIASVYATLLFYQFRRSRNVYRQLSFVLLVTIVALTGVTVPTALGLSPFPHWTTFALTYLLFGVLSIVMTSSIKVLRMLPIDRALVRVSSRFGDPVPLARDVIVQEVDNGIVVLDTDGRVVDVNSTATRMIGVERPVGKRFDEISGPDQTTGGGVLRSVLWGDEPLQELNEQIWVTTPDGELCYDVKISELCDNSGDPAGFVVLLHDITEQKRHAQELERQRNELRTQTKQLEHQNERLDRFASIVSHDLRNPLNVAAGYAEVMLAQADGDGDTAEVDVEKLETIRSSHERMTDIIDDALALAREGKAITETEVVELNAVVEDAWESVETDGATLELTGETTVETDRARLQTLFENLFRNSLEHGVADSDSGTDDASSTGADHDGPDTELVIRVGVLQDGFYVEDNGTGIPEEMADKVFEHGYTTNSVGTGLGLSIVKDIVGGHGWEIDAVEGTAGGARFEVTDVG